MVKIKSMEIEFMCGNTIDDSVEELKNIARIYNAVVSGSFNGKMINSDMTIDGAYKLITGNSKEEFEAGIKKQQEEFKKAEAEHEIKIPSMTDEFRKKARGVVREEKLSKWDEIVPIRLGDLYRGMELEHTLRLIKMLDIDMCHVEEAKKEFYKQGHSGMSAGLIFAMMKEFCVRGKEFVEYLRL